MILISTFIAISVVCLVFLRKSQDDLLPNYHDFADQRKSFGITNFFDVTSNGLFIIFGCLGVYMLVRPKEYDERMGILEFWSFVFFFLAIIGTGMIFDYISIV